MIISVVGLIGVGKTSLIEYIANINQNDAI
jgi:deoxyadenosine/deoxycytidine kinase